MAGPCIALRAPEIKGVRLGGVPGTCFVEGLEGRLRRKREDILHCPEILSEARLGSVEGRRKGGMKGVAGRDCGAV